MINKMKFRRLDNFVEKIRKNKNLFEILNYSISSLLLGTIAIAVVGGIIYLAHPETFRRRDKELRLVEQPEVYRQESGLEKRTLNISNDGVEMIKGFEGFREEAYLCPAGVWTIGYGHTKEVKQGNRVTREQAETILIEDLSIYEKAVRDNVTVSLTQNQYDALVSFVYNIGPEAFRKSTLLKKLNEGDYTGASQEFGRWIHAGGKVSRGLQNRRTKEMEMFLEND